MIAIPRHLALEPLDSERDLARLSMRQRNGACFELAAKYVLDGPCGGAALVHGLVFFETLSIAHAVAIAPSGRLYDPTLALFFSADDYKRYTRFKLERWYTRSALRRMLLEHQTWGPWHETRGLMKEKGRIVDGRA